MKRYTLLILVAFCLCLAATGLADEAGTITDATGTAVPVCLDAQRIVSLAPNVTEMICYVGLGERLVGRSDFCDYPPQVLELPSVGGFVDTSLEAIVALDPDLVIAYQGNSLELVAQLRAVGVTVLALSEATDLAAIADQMRVAALVADSDYGSASELANRFRHTIDHLPSADARLFTVFYGYPGELMYSCAPGTFIGDLMTRAGGQNIIEDNSVRWPQVSAELVIAANPDYILTSTSCTENQEPAAVRTRLISKLQADVFWSKLEAVRAGRVIVIDSDLLNRPGPRIIQAYEQLIDQLDPEHRPMSTIGEAR